MAKPNVPPRHPMLDQDRTWYQKKGYFQVWVTDVMDCGSHGTFIQFFNIQNCGQTYQEYRHAESGPGVVYKSWYESNHLQVMALDRFLSSFTQTPIPLVRCQIKEFDHHGNEITDVPLSFEP